MNCEKIKNKVSIRMVLESFNLFPVKENQRTAFYFALDRVEVVPSFSVDFVKNAGFDFGTGKSYDVISIVQQINKCSVSEALKYLSEFNFCGPEKDFKNEKTKKNYQILEVNEIKHPALIKYLKSRKVFEQSHFVKEIYYELNERKYFGIGFYNNSGGVEIRNKYSKICLGKKDITLIKNSNQNNEICVFEGFFDYLTLRNIEKSENVTSDYLILNSTAMLFKADDILKNYDRISLFLDNDPNGEITKKIIQQKYQNVEDCSLLYCDFKDFSEWFCSNSAFP
ncbi:DNA primase [Kaistella flava (ex Peng et al. 2021)]|uniref:DNA primase n=1 Tax=Kaistella flava (ex Peng et al. 2021) TaxID=2038776 RepID=A0A7M2Y8E6_9FLAO|nr:toprim domain-containing protein [Kaistella flava (ex Peng et al. 2021)]QOW09905.1 DNA primase [Kaistella flava (ex Peng et al. 2021)]